MAESILSDRVDGFGFFYGFRDKDHRQINVRLEPGEAHTPGRYVWRVYVGGEKIGMAFSKKGAEEVAITWMDDHPVGRSADE